VEETTTTHPYKPEIDFGSTESDPELFLETLYQNCEGGTVEFRPLPKEQPCFVPVDQLELPELPNGKNIYLGVATRDGKGGARENLVQIPAVWVDIDFKTTPEEKAWELIKDFPLHPTMVVHSGNGLHCYWVFSEPVSGDEFEKVENINWGLINNLGGDPACWDASRIMRLPGTFNHKSEPPKPVKLLECNPTEQFQLGDFEAVMPDTEAPRHQKVRSPSCEAVERVVKNCPAVQKLVEAGGGKNEPEWFLLFARLAAHLGPAGAAWFHEVSRKWPGYDPEVAQNKLDRAWGYEPPKCSDLKGSYDCGKTCTGIQTPVDWANSPDQEGGTRPGTIEVFDFADLATAELPPEPHLIDRLIPRNGLVILAGTPKLGKSYIALDMVMQGMLAKPFLEMFKVDKPFTTLFIEAEDTKQGMQKRELQLLRGYNYSHEALRGLKGMATRFRLDDDGLKMLEGYIQQHRPDLVVLDALKDFVPGGMNDTEQVMPVLHGLWDIIHQHNASFLLIHHTRKSGTEKKYNHGIDDVLGSTTITGSVDSIIIPRPTGSKLKMKVSFDLRKSAPLDDIVIVRETFPKESPCPEKLWHRQEVTWKDMDPKIVAEFLGKQGREMASEEFCEAVSKEFDVSIKLARDKKKQAVDQGWILEKKGEKPGQKLLSVNPAQEWLL
jgi:hypothetical protein